MRIYGRNICHDNLYIQSDSLLGSFHYSQIRNKLLVRMDHPGLWLRFIFSANHFRSLGGECCSRLRDIRVRGGIWQVLCFYSRIVFRYRSNLLVNMIIPAFNYLLREKIKYSLILNSIDMNLFYLINESLLKVIHEFQTLFSCFTFIDI